MELCEEKKEANAYLRERFLYKLSGLQGKYEIIHVGKKLYENYRRIIGNGLTYSGVMCGKKIFLISIIVYQRPAHIKDSDVYCAVTIAIYSFTTTKKENSVQPMFYLL